MMKGFLGEVGGCFSSESLDFFGSQVLFTLTMYINPYKST